MEPEKCGFCKAPMGERWLTVQIHNRLAAFTKSNFCDPGCIMGALALQGYEPKPVKLNLKLRNPGGEGR